MSWLRNLRFRTKMQLAFLLAALLPVLLLGLAAVRIAYGSLDEEIRTGIRSYSQKTSDTMKRSIHTVAAQLDNIVYSDDFIRLLKDVEYGEAGVNDVQAECERLQFATTLEGARIHSMEVMFRKEIDTPWLSERTREVLADIDRSDLRDAQEVWYPDENRLYLIREAYDYYNNEPLARVIVVIDGGRLFEEAVGNVEDKYGILVAYQESRYAYVAASGVMISGIPSVETLRRAGDSVFAFNGRQYLVERYPLDGTQLVLYSIASYDAAVRTMREVALTILAVVALSILVVSASSFVFSARFTRRIDDIIDQIQTVQAGHFYVEFSESDGDEIGQLQNAFSELVERLDDLVRDVYESQLAQKDLRLKALQAQINPHFLYNCLDNLNWTAIMNGDDHANQVINQLSLFYRTSLNHGNDFTTVSRELDNARAYMALQLDLHEHSFVFETDIQEGLGEYTIINLVLQPALENALNHGIHQLEDGEEGYIRLRAEKVGDRLIFTIDNSGPPISPEMIDQVLITKGKGYGINNVNERIKLFFGNAYGIRLSPLRDGTRCILTIPARFSGREVSE